MQNIHDLATVQEFTKRIETLRPDSQRQWGKMSVSQMLAHCANALEVSAGDKVLKQTFMGKIFGKIAKKQMVSAAPFKRDLPTAPEFKIADEKEFKSEKQRLLQILKKRSAADPAIISKNPHPFFGKMTPEEWNTMDCKHLDHHLKQFNA